MTTTLGSHPECPDRASGPLRRRPAIRVATVAIGLAVVGAACGTTTDAGSEAAVNADPAIDTAEVIVSGSVATLVANVSDADGDLTSVSIEWGDGAVDTVTSGFPAVRADHSYTTPGPHTVIVQATDATGRSALTTTVAATDGSSLPTEPPATEPPSTEPPSTEPPVTEPPTTPPPPPPPPVTEPPSTEPPPPPPTEPPAPPEPITVDLLDANVTYGHDITPPDDAGGSAEARAAGDHAVNVRSYAWHGYNGVGDATATLTRTIDAGPAFVEFGPATSEIVVDLDFTVTGRGELKGPWDRTSTVEVWADVSSLDPIDVFTETRGDNDSNPVASVGFDGVERSARVVLTPDAPTATFSLNVRCHSTSGPMAFALLNEGYCDFFEQGQVTLTALRATLTPSA